MNHAPDRLPVPLPDVSVAIHKALELVRVQNPAWPKVPVPLILSGAAFSTAAAIRQRWRETIIWAEQHQCMDILLAHYVLPPEGVDVASNLAGVDSMGNGWWPDNSHWNSEPRPKRTDEDVRNALQALKLNWQSVVGEALSAALDPVAITGPKSRRLVVNVITEVVPPWGTWESANADPASFRDFRRRVNTLIAPLEVDHIDFVVPKRTG